MLTYRGAVYPWHCDHMGHMNVQSYVAKFDEATWQLFGAFGLTRSYLSAAGRGMAGVEQHISYLKELFAGSLVTVHSTVLEVRSKVLRFQHEMTDDESGAPAARTTLVAVHLDLRSRQPCPFDDEIAGQARALIAAAPTA